MNPVVAKRAELGWTQAQLAERADVGLATVIRAEAGHRPSVIVAGKLARALDLPLEELRPADVSEEAA